MGRHVDLHLNLGGGLTGDMFIAAVLDAFPQYEQRVIAAIDALDAPYPVACSLVAHANYEVSGHRFEIEPFDKYFGYIPFAFSQERASWESVRERLSAADIKPDVRTHATRIFELLAKAESAVWGIGSQEMPFEVGGWNSIAQVMGAAALIDALEPARWTASPFGSGEVVTLTGAAIVDYLCPSSSPRSRAQLPRVRNLVRSGTGFGPQNSCLRLMCFEEGDESFAGLEDSAHAPPRAAGRVGEQPSQ
jgi:pyridinium-3,5-bisthiocarboxylic acid mononucleotide nickel chelatase